MSYRSVVAATVLALAGCASVETTREQQQVGLTNAHCSKPNSCVNVVDIGQGNCVHVTCPNGDQTLIDCGRTISSTREYKPYFDNIAAKRNLKSVVITHGDIDHFNQIVQFFKLETYTFIENVVVASGWRNWPNKKYKIVDWIKQAEDDADITVTTLGTGSRGVRPTTALSCSSPSLNGKAGFYILAADVKGDKNTRSIVLRFQPAESSSGSIILPGDATKKTEVDTLEYYTGEKRNLLNVDFYLIGHHGAEGTRLRTHNQ